jgi:hypothetical protein
MDESKKAGKPEDGSAYVANRRRGGTFLDRNKKKSSLALLLLFLRERKILVLLLFLVLGASTIFLSPSSFITGLPGGARFAAGVAWIAGKVGVDVSKWGLGPGAGGQHSYSDLLAAFRAAKAGAGGAGWGAFFGRPAGGGSVPNSLDMVKASRSDLDSGSGSNGPAKNQTIQGVVDPSEAKADKDGTSVALTDADLGGQREGFVKSAFAGGFASGLFGGAGNAGGSGRLSGLSALGGADGPLSGGAYAGRGFFGGAGGAASATSADRARQGLSGLAQFSVPKTKIAGAANGHLSASRSHIIETRSVNGAAAAGVGANKAFAQLAQGRGRAALSTTPNCVPPDCPGEYAAVNTGAIYDGNSVSRIGADTSILTATAVGDASHPVVPDSGIAQDYVDKANQMEADAEKCKALDAQYGPQETALNQHMTDISNQFKNADCQGGGCSRSKADYCQGLGNQLKASCNAYMQVRCAHTHACPLTANVNCSGECAGATGQTAHTMTTTSDTTGNSDGSGGITVPQ